MAYETKIILDSVTPAGARLTTFQFTLPRIVLAEFNTHRMFSRNSASSRAIPVEKQIQRVIADPFIPRYFGKNQKGMQAGTELEEEERSRAMNAWMNLIDSAVKHAQVFKDIGLHKQLANRVLEVVNWHTIVCTATEYENYWGLRDNTQAAPEIRDSAHEGQELYRKSEPVLVKEGDWHLPYVTGYDFGSPTDGRPFDEKAQPGPGWTVQELIAMSAGRCAAVSYLNQDNQLDPHGDIKRTWERLIPGGHMSPSEHPAKSLTREEWIDVATQQCRDWIHNRVPVGNFWGWLQWRKTLPNEHDFNKIQKTA